MHRLKTPAPGTCIRRSKYFRQSFSRTGAALNVLHHGYPTHEGDFYGVKCFDVIYQTILHCLILRFKRTKHAVPNDQLVPIIFIDILVVRSVVHTMVRGRIKYHFQGPQIIYDLGVAYNAPESTYDPSNSNYRRV